MSNFNFLARFYDGLSHIVFQKNIELANRQLVKWVKPNSNVLILGGGTGELLSYFPESVMVDYVELSNKMIDKAKVRPSVSTNVFYDQDFLKFTSIKKYDYILCPFFLDLFVPSDLDKVIKKIKTHLQIDARLLVADFSPKETGFVNKVLLEIMILFFRIFSGIGIKRYNNLFDKVEGSDFEAVDQASRKSKFILMKNYKFI